MWWLLCFGVLSLATGCLLAAVILSSLRTAELEEDWYLEQAGQSEAEAELVFGQTAVSPLSQSASSPSSN